MATIAGIMTPQQAWVKLDNYKKAYYDSKSALYSGDHDALHDTAENKTFWRRSGVSRIHVPIAADIASTSANLMFSNEPTYTIVRNGQEVIEDSSQKRLEYILFKNNIHNKLSESGETASALGDVYFKVRWNATGIDYPIIDVVQPDQAWPEYILGELRCVHFFNDLSVDLEHDVYIRVYECYSKGKIAMALFKGTKTDLGSRLEDSELEELGYKAEINAPVDDLLAVHIANARPNRLYRASMLGRSDLDGLRDLCDALDETYSSWMRDIRLGKARLIVPVDYLRKKPQSMIDGVSAKGAWEFDTDVETYVAMDIDIDRAGGTGITPSQFQIRSAEHAATCTDIVRNILQHAGYSPQSFGLEINGSSSSGTALNIRERKSAATANKKLSYWQSPLEQILTSIVRIDHALYPNGGSVAGDTVSVSFADSMGTDPSTIASTIEMLSRAHAVSIITMVRMQHPDWSEKQVIDEVERIKEENELIVDEPDINKGDFETPPGNSGDNDNRPEDDNDDDDEESFESN